MSAENDDERTPAAGPADAGQQAGGSNCGSGSSRPSGRMGQRPRRDRNNRGPARPTESAPRGKKFTGRCKELMGEICDCSAHNQVDCCTKTTKEVAENVGRTCSSDTRTAAETLILPTFDCPSDPATGARETEKRKWTKRVDTMVCREDRFDEDPKKVHSLIWGQCTELAQLRKSLDALVKNAPLRGHSSKPLSQLSACLHNEGHPLQSGQELNQKHSRRRSACLLRPRHPSSPK
jgi:hypothetical protein